MKEESRPVFVTDDGEVFATEQEALEHEARLRERQKALASLKVRMVVHGFDETEGRGYFAKTLVVTDESSAVLLQWCLDKFGQPLDSWYGDSFYERWYLTDPSASDDVEWALAHNGYKPGDYHTPWKLAVVSKRDFTWAGLPKSEHPWPRPKDRAR
jgi:maltose-binding protein MalE